MKLFFKESDFEEVILLFEFFCSYYIEIGFLYFVYNGWDDENCKVKR